MEMVVRSLDINIFVGIINTIIFFLISIISYRKLKKSKVEMKKMLPFFILFIVDMIILFTNAKIGIIHAIASEFLIMFLLSKNNDDINKVIKIILIIFTIALVFGVCIININKNQVTNAIMSFDSIYMLKNILLVLFDIIDIIIIIKFSNFYLNKYSLYIITLDTLLRNVCNFILNVNIVINPAEFSFDMYEELFFIFKYMVSFTIIDIFKIYIVTKIIYIILKFKNGNKEIYQNDNIKNDIFAIDDKILEVSKIYIKKNILNEGKAWMRIELKNNIDEYEADLVKDKIKKNLFEKYKIKSIFIETNCFSKED